MRPITTYIATLCAVTIPSSAFHLPSQQTLNTAPASNTIDPCTLATSPLSTPSLQLSSWLECAINAFYPYPANTAWDKAHASTFSTDVRFTFNDTHYDFSGQLALYKSFNATLGQVFAPFTHGFTNSLGVPNGNGDLGGFVYVIGWMGGYFLPVGKEVYWENAAFAVVKEVDGERRIVEFRESSMIPNSAELPEERGWDCKFEKEKVEL